MANEPAPAPAAGLPRVATGLAAIRQLDYLILLCSDVEKMRRFYVGVLGLEVYRDLWDGNWLELRLGSTLLTLRPRGMAAIRGQSFDGPPAPDSASVQLAFRVAPGEIDACSRELSAAGVEIVDPPTDQPWGHRTLFFLDPERNLLEIYADI